MQSASKSSATPMALSNAALAELPAGILAPVYDRAALRSGIVHIGVGNFHRAHQAWYLHRLMQEGQALDWAIVGAGVRPNDAAMRDKLLAQDCLTTLIELDPNGRSAEVAGAMIDFLPVQDGHAPLIAQMADPAIRIVSLTVTEGGYYIDPVTKEFDTAHLDIQADVASPDSPRTAFGAIVAALRVRKAAGHGPFTVLSCDNLQGNGRIVRDTVLGVARLQEPVLADWIAEHGSFPNSMVDCIVPATGPNEIALAGDFGLDDAVPVTHENFRQWVLEDDFCAGRPEWEAVGAIFTKDVHSFESMKIRILNAGHQLLANPGEILSVDTIADCMAHPLISALFNKIQTEAIAPHVDAVPGMTAAAYVELISSRFANPEIRDTTRRVAFDGSSRHTGFLLPTLRDALAAGTPIDGFALAEALWARMCEGTRENGTTIEPNDPFWADLNAAATAAKDNPQAWLEQASIYGDLADNSVFSARFGHWLSMIWEQGTEATLRAFTGQGV